MQLEKRGGGREGEVHAETVKENTHPKRNY